MVRLSDHGRWFTGLAATGRPPPSHSVGLRSPRPKAHTAREAGRALRLVTERGRRCRRRTTPRRPASPSVGRSPEVSYPGCALLEFGLRPVFLHLANRESPPPRSARYRTPGNRPSVEGFRLLLAQVSPSRRVVPDRGRRSRVQAAARFGGGCRRLPGRGMRPTSAHAHTRRQGRARCLPVRGDGSPRGVSAAGASLPCPAITTAGPEPAACSARRRRGPARGSRSPRRADPGGRATSAFAQLTANRAFTWRAEVLRADADR